MNFKLIMPMAGNGSRFAEAGYTDPKPMIDIDGKPMFVRAVESIGLEFEDYIFIVRKEHNLVDSVRKYYPNAKVVEIEQLTEGAACTVLLANPYLNDEDAVLVSNCDQVIEWDSKLFRQQMDNDGVIMTFNCPERDPKWSFARIENDTVVEVAEKNPISTHATSGHYYWSHWVTFKTSANRMIQNNERTNGEFYLCPVYNETIRAGGKVTISNIDKRHGLGTPEDLELWLNS